jgi:O-antigen/teichoic acid export membrane protein
MIGLRAPLQSADELLVELCVPRPLDDFVPAEPANTALVEVLDPVEPLVAHDAARSLTRNAVALVINAAGTSLLGMAFWVIAARLYPEVKLGQDAAMVSTMLLLAALSELNLGVAIPRFLPQLGRRSAKAVMLAYGVSSLSAIVVSMAVVLIVPNISKSLHFLGGNWGLGAMLCTAVVLWNIFALQDSVLTAVRRSSWIPIENVIFGLAKIVLMVWWAESTIDHSVFLAWVVPMIVMLIPVNVALFRWALPRHERFAPATESEFLRSAGRRGIMRFLALDYVASLLLQGATTMMPLIVVATLGAEQNAYFYVAYQISGAMDSLAHNVGLSLTVEGSFDERALGRLTRHTFVRFAVMLTPVVIGGMLLAPQILWFFGETYVEHGTTLLQLLLVAAIPQSVLSLYQAIERVRGNAGRIVLVTLGRFVAMLVSVVVAGKLFGLTGIGWACILSQVLVVIPIMPSLVRIMRTV